MKKRLQNQNPGQGKALVWVLAALIFLVLLLLCTHFINTHDDYYVPETGLGFFGSLVYAATMGNGRYLGNFFGNFLSQRELLNGFVRAAVIFGIVILAWTLFGKGKSRTLAAAALLFLFPGRGVFAQAYVWSHGFHNYAAPILLILLSLFCLRREESAGNRAALLFLGCAQCLFSENTSIVCFLLAGSLLLLALKRGQGSPANCRAYLLGVLLGLFLCFLMPRITGVSEKMGWYRGFTVAGEVDAFRSYDLSSLHRILSQTILKLVSIGETVFRWHLFWCGFGLALALRQGERGEKGQWLALAAAAALYCLLVLLTALKDSGAEYRLYSYGFLLAAALFLALLCSLVCRLFAARGFFWLSAFLIAASLGELLFVAPIGQRCFYLPFAIAACLQISLWSELELRSPRLSRAVDGGVWLAAAALSLYLLVIFFQIHAAYRLRTDYIQRQIARGETEIRVVEIPHDEYVYLGNASTMFGSTYGEELGFRYISPEEYAEDSAP